MNTWAYVFVTSRQPKKVLRLVRRIPGVVHADALFGSPDLIAIVEGTDVASMDAVIDAVAAVPDVVGTDSKVARWIDGVELPFRTTLPGRPVGLPHREAPPDRPHRRAPRGRSVP